MSAVTLFLILVSSIGFLCSSIYSAYLLFVNKFKSTLHLLLGGLLLVLTLRIGKSVFYNFTDLPLFVKNIGLAANLAVGPFLYIYGSVLLEKYKLCKGDLKHFLPAIVYIVLAGIIPNSSGSRSWYISYGLVIFQQVCYLGLSMALIRSWHDAWHHNVQQPFLILWSAISIIWLTFFLIFIKLIPVYIFGAVSYSILVILITYFAVTEGNPFTKKEKYGSYRLPAHQSKKYLSIIQEQLIEGQRYLNPNLSIQDLAGHTNLSTKVISQVTNELLKLNFSAFVNTYRIEEVKQRLASENYRQHTIASIAYDCGFNSISSFNTTFKGLTKQTPSQFRTAAQQSSP